MRPPTARLNRVGFTGADALACSLTSGRTSVLREKHIGHPPNGIVWRQSVPTLRHPRPCGGDPAAARLRGEKTPYPEQGLSRDGRRVAGFL